MGKLMTSLLYNRNCYLIIYSCIHSFELPAPDLAKLRSFDIIRTDKPTKQTISLYENMDVSFAQSFFHEFTLGASSDISYN